MRSTLLAAAAFLALCAAAPAMAQTPDPAVKAFVQKYDRGTKGLLDLKAILNAAIVKFGQLDTEHNGRLKVQQLAYALSPEDFKRANADGDETIGADEWFDIVRQHFYAANPDNDGSLSIDEFETPAGKRLLKLLQ